MGMKLANNSLEGKNVKKLDGLILVRLVFDGKRILDDLSIIAPKVY